MVRTGYVLVLFGVELGFHRFYAFDVACYVIEQAAALMSGSCPHAYLYVFWGIMMLACLEFAGVKIASDYPVLIIFGYMLKLLIVVL